MLGKLTLRHQGPEKIRGGCIFPQVRTDNGGAGSRGFAATVGPW